ncbi:hypothetical protein SUGI_0988170 [Cryptomeria japonica]|nr:hypothetical protein SUGI_0988170 [Cryptomeria japonica]
MSGKNFVHLKLKEESHSQRILQICKGFKVFYHSCTRAHQQFEAVNEQNITWTGRPKIRTTPSMVAFTPDERLVGDAAKFQISTNPTNTVFDVKRLIGRTYNDPSVQSDKQLWPFTMIPGKNDKPMVEVT